MITETYGGSAVAWRHFNRGMLIQSQGSLKEAIHWYDEAITTNTDFFEAIATRAAVQLQLGHSSEALRGFDRAIELRPLDFRLHNDRGITLVKMHRFAEAIKSYDRAIAIYPQCPLSYTNRGRARLGSGLDERGGIEDFKIYDSFFRILDRTWNGEESLVGKTILLHEGGNGIGDTFQFYRYAKPLADRGAQVILSVRPALLHLINTVPGQVSTIADNDPQPKFDYQLAGMNAWTALEQSIATLYAPKSYVRADRTLIATWRKRLGDSRKPRVGLSWWTSTAKDELFFDANTGISAQSKTTGPERCIPLGELVNALPSDFEFISLQHQVRENDQAALRSSSIKHFGAEMTFDAAAAVMECCDLVIAIDSSLAHLAGALGRPLWIALPFNADWRWFSDRTDCPWYPTARLYRQRSEGDWRQPLERIGADLARLIPKTQAA